MQKWRLTLRVMPLVAGIVLLKYAAHALNWEFLTMSPLLTAIISANIFLIGFLITGVLSDFKESEKLPGELAASIETMADEAEIVYLNKQAPQALQFLQDLLSLTESLLKWFNKKERTAALMDQLRLLNQHFLAFESLTQANFIARLKQEQSSLRKTITRIHTIRETSFSATGYAIAEIITVILTFGLIVVKLDPYLESVFFVAFVTFILIYMVCLIRDLDNPFGYYEKATQSDEVSLKPVDDLLLRLKARLAHPGGWSNKQPVK
jgi:hypothetical protein